MKTLFYSQGLYTQDPSHSVQDWRMHYIGRSIYENADYTETHLQDQSHEVLKSVRLPQMFYNR